ncbi:MAG: hypothetical protein ACXAEX_08420 [Promethearchaeota archaeon]
MSETDLESVNFQVDEKMRKFYRGMFGVLITGIVAGIICFILFFSIGLIIIAICIPIGLPGVLVHQLRPEKLREFFRKRVSKKNRKLEKMIAAGKDVEKRKLMKRIIVCIILTSIGIILLFIGWFRTFTEPAITKPANYILYTLAILFGFIFTLSGLLKISNLPYQIRGLIILVVGFSSILIGVFMGNYLIHSGYAKNYVPIMYYVFSVFLILTGIVRVFYSGKKKPIS